MGRVRPQWLLIALLLCGAACGGQTGEPGSGGPVWDGCTLLEFDEARTGPSPKAVLDEFTDQLDVSLYWMKQGVYDDLDQLYRREPGDTVSATRMDMTIAHDPTRETAECVQRLQLPDGGIAPESTVLKIPITMRLSTEDGVDWRFDALLMQDVRSAEIPPSILGQDLPQLEWWPSQRIFRGVLYHPAHGRAAWPTPCGGIAQTSPEDAPFADEPSAATLLAPFKQPLPAVAPDSDMPPLTVTIETHDETACYTSEHSFALDVDVRVQTGGVTISGSSSARFDRPDSWELTWDEICGDVSGSAAWNEYLQLKGSDRTELCFRGNVQLSDEPTIHIDVL